MTSHSIEGLSDGGLREKIARVIDPDAFKTKAEWSAELGRKMADQVFARLTADTTVERFSPRRAEALAKADAIIALSAAPERVEGGGVDSSSQSQSISTPKRAAREAEPSARWRPEIVAFADLMEEKLRENDHKGGWADEHQRHLFDRLKEEADELALLIYHGVPRPRAQNLKAPNSAAVGREAADVANFAMMIADVCGALGPAEPSPSGAQRSDGRGG